MTLILFFMVGLCVGCLPGDIGMAYALALLAAFCLLALAHGNSNVPRH